MAEHSLPFHDPNAMQPRQLADYYDGLFNSDRETFYDERTGLHAVWRHVTVQALLEAPTDAVSNKTALDSLTPFSAFAANPGTWPSLAHLIRVPRVTANASPADGHRQVRQAIIRGEDGLSLGQGPVRTRYGRLIAGTVEQEVRSFADELSRTGTADFALRMQRISAEIISKVLGFEDSTDIKTWADAQTNLLGRNLSRPEQVTGLKGLADLSRGSLSLARQTKAAIDNRQCPRTLMSNMLTHPPERPLDIPRAAAAAMNLVAAGYSTTYGTALNGLKRLLSNDMGRLHWQHMDDIGVADTIINEVTRVETALIGWERYAAKPITLPSGEVIPAHSRILLLLGAANRDPSVFGEQPHDITASPIRNHSQLTFGSRGHDSHYCVGAGLARLELSTLFQYMSHELPSLRVADSDPGTYEGPDYKFRTPASLVLTQ